MRPVRPKSPDSLRPLRGNYDKIGALHEPRSGAASAALRSVCVRHGARHRHGIGEGLGRLPSAGVRASQQGFGRAHGASIYGGLRGASGGSHQRIIGGLRGALSGASAGGEGALIPFLVAVGREGEREGGAGRAPKRAGGRRERQGEEAAGRGAQGEESGKEQGGRGARGHRSI